MATPRSNAQRICISAMRGTAAAFETSKRAIHSNDIEEPQ